MINDALITQNQIIVYSTYDPIYVGQAFNVLIGYVHTDGSFTQVPIGSSLTYRILSPNLVDNGNLVFVPNDVGSFAIAFRYDTGTEILRTIFYFYVARPITRVNYSQIYATLKQELPSSYNNSVDPNSGNYLDNYASAKTITYMYELLYNIIDEQYPANGYTTNWEYALNATNNLFTQAAYPNLLTNLLYQVPYNTGITRFDLTRFIAKFCYYFWGREIRVYIDDENNITVYKGDVVITWILEDPVYSKLAETTYLGSINFDIFGYLLLTFILRYFPIQIKFTLNFKPEADGLTELTSLGFTYYGDIRPIKGMGYIGDPKKPFNLNGYILTI